MQKKMFIVASLSLSLNFNKEEDMKRSLLYGLDKEV